MVVRRRMKGVLMGCSSTIIRTRLNPSCEVSGKPGDILEPSQMIIELSMMPVR
jgi:hypothetical protein